MDSGTYITPMLRITLSDTDNAGLGAAVLKHKGGRWAAALAVAPAHALSRPPW